MRSALTHGLRAAPSCSASLGAAREERNGASLSGTGSSMACALSAGEAVDEGSRLLSLPPSECTGGSWGVSLPFLSTINLPQRGAGTQIRGGMKEDKSTVSAAPHLLDNKQTALLINFSPFPHGSPPVTPAGAELDCSWTFWCPGRWGEAPPVKPGTLHLGWHPSPPTLEGSGGYRMAQQNPIQAHGLQTVHGTPQLTATR